MYKRALCCNLRCVVYKGTAPFSRDITTPSDTQYNFRTHRSIRCSWVRQTRFVRQSFMMEALVLYNSLGVAGRYFEDEKEFRLFITEKLKESFGNGNL